MNSKEEPEIFSVLSQKSKFTQIVFQDGSLTSIYKFVTLTIILVHYNYRLKLFLENKKITTTYVLFLEEKQYHLRSRHLILQSLKT
jgi:hypothetical protein